MNKTQKSLLNRVLNYEGLGSSKVGWTLTALHEWKSFLCLQKLNDGQQAHKLAEKYPDIFRAEQKSFRLVILYVMNESKAHLLRENNLYD